MDKHRQGFDPIDEYASIELEGTPSQDANQQPKQTPAPPPQQPVVTAREPQNTPAYTPQYIPYSQPQQMPPVYPYMGHDTSVYPPQYPQYQNFQPYQQQPVYYQQQMPQAVNSQNPYIQKPQFEKPKEKFPTAAKVYIGIMTGLMLLFLLLFCVSCMSSLSKNTKPKTDDHPLSEFATTPQIQEESLPSYQYGGAYLDKNVVLQADEGHTQQNPDNQDDNTYPPDKDAEEIKTKDLPKDKDDKKYTTQYAYKAVTDSVVSIVCYDGEITGNDKDILSEGTGTIITSDGYIVTNSHVIGDSKAYTINVILNNAKEYRAKIVGFDSRTDLAVLKIDAKDLKAVTFADSDKTEVGQDIVAIGNPGGTSFQNSLTKGIVSAVKRELSFHSNVKYIQIDAAINPGNSGGPLCNIYGQVIGINTAKISDTAYEGMGFAIEGNKVLEIVNDLIHYGYVKDRVRIGITGMEVNYQMSYSYGIPYGILITEIAQGGPFDGTGIEIYDIVTAINGKEVSSFAEVYAELENYAAGDEISVTVYRMEY